MKKKREVQISIIRSRRKTLALQIDRDGNVLVRAPYWVPDDQIARLLREYHILGPYNRMIYSSIIVLKFELLVSRQRDLLNLESIQSWQFTV